MIQQQLMKAEACMLSAASRLPDCIWGIRAELDLGWACVQHVVRADVRLYSSRLVIMRHGHVWPHLEPVCKVHQHGRHVGHAEQHPGELVPGLQVCLPLVLSHDLQHSHLLSTGSEHSSFRHATGCEHDLPLPLKWAADMQCLSAAGSRRLMQ